MYITQGDVGGNDKFSVRGDGVTKLDVSTSDGSSDGLTVTASSPSFGGVNTPAVLNISALRTGGTDFYLIKVCGRVRPDACLRV
jgi:hypothetical protein